MKRKNINICVFIVIGIGLLIIVGLNYEKESSIRRSFQKTVLEQGEIITITLNVFVEGDESYYAIEEHIPVGWIVIDDAGVKTKQATVWINGIEVISGILFNGEFESMAIFVDFLPDQDNFLS